MDISDIGGQGCLGTGTNTPAANFVGINVLTVTCPFADATTTAYDIQMVQGAGASTVVPPYTVDFKVDGVTIPELSGEMQPVVANDLTGVTVNQRNFRFTNDNMQGTPPVVTELFPAPSGGFLEIVVTPTGTGDGYALAIVREPANIGGTGCAVTTVAGTPGPATPATDTQTLGCAFYGVGVTDMAGYEFTLTVTDAGSDTILDGYTVTTRFNGVQVSERVVDMAAAGVATFPITETIKYRIDSPTGPLIALP